MRVTFQHREEQEFGGKSYYVDCTVLFSEEEKAVIRNREFGRGLRFDSPRRPAGLTATERTVSTVWAFTNTIYFPFVFCMLGAFIWAANAVEGTTSFFGPLILFGAPILYVVSKVMSHREEHSLDEQLVRFDHLFDGRPFTVWAVNPSDAKRKESAIEEKLAGIKQLINESVELGQKRTVEL